MNDADRAVEKARHHFDDMMRLMSGTPAARKLVFEAFDKGRETVRWQTLEEAHTEHGICTGLPDCLLGQLRDDARQKAKS